MTGTGAVRAVLFDLDGTLVDTLDGITDSLNFALQSHRAPPKRPFEVRRYIGGGFRDLLGQALGSGREALVEPAMKLFAEHYRAHCTEKAVLYPGTREMLESLSGAAFGIVTNKPEAHSLEILKSLGLDGFFPVVIGGDTLPKRKPDPDPLLAAGRRLGAAPAWSVMIGDSPSDIEAGRAAGMKTGGVTFGYRERDEMIAAKPDFLVDHLSDIPAKLKGLWP